MEERSKLQKAVLISMAAMVVLFGVLMVAARFQKGVEFEGGLLRRTETEESVIYNGKVRGEQVEITVRAAGSGNLTEVDFRIGNRIQDDCTLETGLPPIQAEQLGPVEHIRITKNDILLFEGGYDPEYGMGGRASESAASSVCFPAPCIPLMRTPLNCPEARLTEDTRVWRR